MDNPQGWKKSAFNEKVRSIREEVIKKVHKRVPGQTDQRGRLAEASKICMEMADGLFLLRKVSNEKEGDSLAVDGVGKEDLATPATKGVSEPLEQPVKAPGKTLAGDGAGSTHKSSMVATENLSPTEIQRLPYARLSKWVTTKSEDIGRGYNSLYGLRPSCDYMSGTHARTPRISAPRATNPHSATSTSKSYMIQSGTRLRHFTL